MEILAIILVIILAILTYPLKKWFDDLFGNK